MNKITLIFWAAFIFGLILPLGSAQINWDSVKQNECINLDQTCATCTTVNITFVGFPNDTAIFPNYEMTKNGSKFNYSFCSTTGIGSYHITLQGDKGGTATTEEGYFEVTGSGFEESSSFNRATYFLFGIAALFFLGFLFIPSKEQKMNENGIVEDVAANVPLRWTFFLLFIMFLMLGTNVTFISIYNSMGDTNVGAIFDKLSVGSLYMFWFSFGILLILWLFMTIATLADRKRTKQAELIGSPTSFGY